MTTPRHPSFRRQPPIPRPPSRPELPRHPHGYANRSACRHNHSGPHCHSRTLRVAASGISSAAFAHTCGLRKDGTAVCWPTIQEEGLAVLLPPEEETFASISSGAYHVCGLREDGTPVCWLVIEGFFGGALEDTLAPPPEGETFTSISSGVAHTCGLRENGTPVCWLIVEEEGTSIQPPPEGETFVSISSGAYHTCGLRENGTPACWAVIAELVGDALAPARGDGSVVCWGKTRTRHRRAGGSFPSAAAPRTSAHFTRTAARTAGETTRTVKYRLRSPFMFISSGLLHTCGLREDGTSVCWWVAGEGFGFGSGSPSPPEEERFVSISSGLSHTCGLREDGTHT